MMSVPKQLTLKLKSVFGGDATYTVCFGELTERNIHRLALSRGLTTQKLHGLLYSVQSPNQKILFFWVLVVSGKNADFSCRNVSIEMNELITTNLY